VVGRAVVLIGADAEIKGFGVEAVVSDGICSTLQDVMNTARMQVERATYTLRRVVFPMRSGFTCLRTGDS